MYKLFNRLIMKLTLLSILTAFISGIIFIGCGTEKENNSGNTFLKDEYNISICEQTKYDVRSKITLEKNEFTGRLDSKVNLNFFNYGGSIVIDPKYQEDIFASIAQYSQYYIVSSENITIENVTDDEIYGEWGIGNVDVPNYNRYFTDVFISPLALHKINSHDDDNYLLLAKFMCVETNSCFTGVFLCDHTVSYIVSSNYNNIITCQPISFQTDFNWNLRKELMPKDIHNKYLETEKYVHMGIVDRSSLKFADKYILR